MSLIRTLVFISAKLGFENLRKKIGLTGSITQFIDIQGIGIFFARLTVDDNIINLKALCQEKVQRLC